MKVAVDIRPLLSRPTGVGIWLHNILAAMKKYESSFQWVYFSSSMKERFPEGKLEDFPPGRLVDLRIPVKILNFLFYNFRFPSLEFLTGEKLDITLSPNPMILPSYKAKKIVTVHDLFFYENPEKVEKEFGSLYRKNLEKSLKGADAIIAVSRYTASKIKEYFGMEEKIRVIPEAAREFPKPEVVKGLPQNFFLFIGGCQPRKNLSALVKALDMLEEDVYLVVVGGKPCLSSKKIIWLSYLSDSQLHYLYKNSLALICPSFDEGFGLPVLEAMSLGVPVACSRAGALPEAAGEAALYFDPAQPEEIAFCMKQLLSEERRKELSAKGMERASSFSWDRAAASLIELLKELK